MTWVRGWAVWFNGLVICGNVLTSPTPARAAEGAHGVWLLGLNGPGAGIVPPPGVYFINQFYYYEGSAGANRPIPTVSGQVVANVSGHIRLDLASVMWSTPVQILGGNLAFTALLPIGGPVVDVGATLAPVVSGARHDSIFSIGDPVVGALIGWHAGNWHWKVGVNGFFPIGDYRQGALANVANHRLSVDLNGGVTWLDPSIGLEMSAVVGVTFNQENEATNYKTGDEFHLDWAIKKNLTPAFTVGMVGYYYEQLTGDSGPGAVFGAFKGRVAALGGMLGYNFKLGDLPVSTNLRIYREFDVKNRLEGTGGFFQLSVPLYVYDAPRPMTAMITK